MQRHRLAAALASLVLAAQPGARADQKPAPPPSGPASTKSSAPTGSLAAAIQKPDLVVTFEGPSPGLPTGFTVRNIGSADSKAAVLKVTATLVPLAPSGGGSGSCLPFLTPQECADLQAFGAQVLGPGSGGAGGSTSNDSVTKACGNPFPEFLEAVPALKPGESKSFTRNKGPYQVSMTGFLTQTASPETTHLKQCAPTLVCAWDVTAVVDASNDNDERSKANNTATRRAVREVTFK